MLDLKPLQPALAKLQNVEQEIQLTLIERDEPVHVAILSLVMREHLVLLGMPGTAKSMLINELARRVSPASGGGLRTFIYLLTKFTTPEELFGPISINGLKSDDYRRVTAGKVPESELIFLDEVFKGSSAILNYLLRGMNERLFENGSQTIQMPLISLFGASNEMPQGQDLDAMWDRFLIRLFVEYVSDTGFAKLLQLFATKAAAQTTPQTISQAELVQIQAAASQVELPGSTLSVIEQLRRELKNKGITISDRRWGWSLKALQAQALLDGRPSVNEDDLSLLKHTLWLQPEQITEIGRILARMGNPLNAKAAELADSAEDVFQKAIEVQNQGGSEEEKMSAAIEGTTKLKKIKTSLEAIRRQVMEQGRSSAKVDGALSHVLEQQRQITALVL